ncbi:helix-turn-helix domain-containing protein [Corallococcus llansteffanensis]|uniref:XRE family transcriptional regulator n=1 Tax=Corallococcus llansteffanensis TaxID=2316731 RepID=A0A3A8QFL8_9BACT|nr:helix-turn-helix domain-containing protein [Corallococcus llansteffanensis]RKH67493.1 XRE family transcriptional regulator [Corallococcus llansteffanensis]
MNQELAEIIGTAARAARDKMGLTQAEVAERIQLTPLVYSRLERGKMLPSVPSLVRLCAALHLSPEEALGFSPRKARAGKKGGRGPDDETLQRLLYISRRLEAEQLTALLGVATAMLRR